MLIMQSPACTCLSEQTKSAPLVHDICSEEKRTKHSLSPDLYIFWSSTDEEKKHFVIWTIIL